LTTAIRDQDLTVSDSSLHRKYHRGERGGISVDTDKGPPDSASATAPSSTIPLVGGRRKPSSDAELALFNRAEQNVHRDTQHGR